MLFLSLPSGSASATAAPEGLTNTGFFNKDTFSKFGYSFSVNIDRFYVMFLQDGGIDAATCLDAACHVVSEKADASAKRRTHRS